MRTIVVLAATTTDRQRELWVYKLQAADGAGTVRSWLFEPGGDKPVTGIDPVAGVSAGRFLFAFQVRDSEVAQPEVQPEPLTSAPPEGGCE